MNKLPNYIKNVLNLLQNVLELVSVLYYFSHHIEISKVNCYKYDTIAKLYCTINLLIFPQFYRILAAYDMFILLWYWYNIVFTFKHDDYNSEKQQVFVSMWIPR